MHGGKGCLYDKTSINDLDDDGGDGYAGSGMCLCKYPGLNFLPRLAVQINSWNEGIIIYWVHNAYRAWSLCCSELVTPFQVDFAEPFKIEPRDGTLQPFCCLKLKASFRPTVPAVYYRPVMLRVMLTCIISVSSNMMKGCLSVFVICIIVILVIIC